MTDETKFKFIRWAKAKALADETAGLLSLRQDPVEAKRTLQICDLGMQLLVQAEWNLIELKDQPDLTVYNDWIKSKKDLPCMHCWTTAITVGKHVECLSKAKTYFETEKALLNYVIHDMI